VILILKPRLAHQANTAFVALYWILCGIYRDNFFIFYGCVQTAFWIGVAVWVADRALDGFDRSPPGYALKNQARLNRSDNG
jgi:hypothetical protein